MRLPDFPSTAGPFAPPPLPVRAAGGGPVGGGLAAGFGALMGSVRQEVQRFIESGSGAGMEALGGLSPQAAWRRAQQARVDGASPAAAGADALAPVEGASREEQRAFLDRIAPMAQRAAERLGVAPELVAAHAALESGWGQRPLTASDGRSTHNLFGIKAGGAWRGAATEALTTEYEGGEAQRTTQSFRRYDNLDLAFGDYASLLRSSPRYQDALHVGGDARAFANALARGGYATDPAYADKLTAVARQIQGAR